MQDLTSIFYLLILVFLILGLFYNIIYPNLPKLPGDVYIDKPGIKIYIPFASAILLAIILTLLYNLFKK